MPWSSEDAIRFKKKIAPGSKQKWAEIANSVLRDTGDEGKSIRIANGMTRSAVERRMKRKTGVGGFN